MTAAALLLAAVIEIQMTNGVSVADAFYQAAEARAADEQAEIVINVDLSGKALNRSIFIDDVMQPRGRASSPSAASARSDRGSWAACRSGSGRSRATS